MRKLWIIVLLLIAFQSFGQRLRYKDLFPMIYTSQEETALMMLKEYLISEPEHANANYMLAGIYATRYLSSDVLTQHETALANAEQVQLRILKCRTLIDQREIRRNDEYYLDENGNPMNYQTVDSILTVNYESANEFTDKAPAVYENFTSSVFYYDKTIKIYAEICGAYNSLDNLLMLYDDELEAKLSNLENYYDSTLYFFNEYKRLTEEYPIGYDQQLVIKEIERFRLQGLVGRVDFLQPEIPIWNYGKWSEEIRGQVRDVVGILREKLNANHREIEQAYRAEVSEGEEFKSRLDNQMVYDLEKLDFQSLPVAILNYRDFINELRYKESNKRYYDTAESLDAASKYIYYSEIINQIREADTLLNIVESRNVDAKRSKHMEFMSEFYGGASGLQQYISLQKSRNTEKFQEYVLGMRNAIVENNRESTSIDSGQYVTFKRKKYPKWVTGSTSQPEAGTIYTTHQKVNPDGSVYIGGIYLKESDVTNTVSYIGKIANDKVQWLREFDISVDSVKSDANNVLGALELTKEGVLVVINSKHLTSDLSLNTFYYLDDNGKDTFVRQLEEIVQFPRVIKYFEAQNRFILAFSGDDIDQPLDQDTQMQIAAFNGVGDQLWVKSQSFAGRFVDITGLSDGYLLTANYTHYEDSSLESKTGLLTIRLDSRGNVISDLPLESSEGFYITHVIKASDSNINFLGFKGNLSDYDGSGLRYDRNLVHIILDGRNQLVSSSLN